jgi:hypothetical protein
VPPDREPQAVDAAAEHGQQGRQHHQGADRGQGDHRDAGVAERPQEVERETSSASRATATVAALNSTVRPAVAMVTSRAADGSRPPRSSSR